MPYIHTHHCTQKAHWVYSITTRIKTKHRHIISITWPRLIEYIPLQQGLRQKILLEVLHKCNSHWVYSITTRIKTTAAKPAANIGIALIEYIPLQQGLRHLHS